MNNLFSATLDYKGDVVLSGGQTILNFHSAGACAGDFCPVHNPSDHEFRDLPLWFNGQSMLRTLEDGTEIVDPDDYLLNQGKTVIVRNSAKCLNCGDEIVSLHRHDFKECSCKNVFVDGGISYIRQGCANLDNFESTSITFSKKV